MQTIGKYRIESTIGTGGMGVVYKAWDPYFERRVAIKTLSDSLCSDPEFRARFFREGRSMAKLSHGSIVAVYDLGEEDGRPYLAMEYLEGSDLRSELRYRPRVPLERAIRIIQEVAAGLAYAHQRDLVHRDVKPGNIFLTVSNQVKILDFGLARGVTAATLTHRSATIGTPAYMAPEQWQDSHVDHRADIFGLGAIFYEMLNGCRAFDGETYEQIFVRVFYEDPKPIDPRIPPELGSIVLRALAKKPDDRFQDLGGMLLELEAFVASLEERKGALRQRAAEAVGELERVIAEEKTRLERSPDELAGAPLARAFLRPPAPADQGATVRRLPQDYLALYDLCRQAEAERELLAARLGR